MTLHPCCPDEELVIDGLWMVKDTYYGVAWTCRDCEEKGLTG